MLEVVTKVVAKIPRYKKRRICPKCAGSMKRDGVFTQRYDFWSCKRCGFWDSVPRK